jgi:hypothetical protein
MFCVVGPPKNFPLFSSTPKASRRLHAAWMQHGPISEVGFRRGNNAAGDVRAAGGATGENDTGLVLEDCTNEWNTSE